MSLLDILRGGVKIVNTVTKPLQASVKWQSYKSTDEYGTITRNPPRIIPVLVDWKQQQVRTSSGELTVSRASLIILDPTLIINDHDLFTLPDQKNPSPVLTLSGFTDAGTTHPLATQVYLG